MIEDKVQLQNEVSNLIHQDIIQIATFFGQNNHVSIDLLTRFIQDILLLKTYDVRYIHNSELDEIIEILKESLQENRVIHLACVTALNYLIGIEKDLKKALYVYLFLQIPKEVFLEAFTVFSVMNNSVKALFADFITYIFNDTFLDLDEKIQIDCLYKAWNLSLQVFHDNEASKYAYTMLLKLFEKALIQRKTEVVFWLYYTPLNYYKSGVASDLSVSTKEFKEEVEKPLEKYILEYIVPLYKLKQNDRKIDTTKKQKVAFVMQRIIRHSTMNVFYTLVKSLMQVKQNECEFYIYDMSFAESGGSDLSFVEEFKELGIKYINLHEKIFHSREATYSLLEKCLKMREILIKDKVDVLIGLHTRVEYIFLYATRTAPKQIYWFHHSNAVYDIVGIDERISHCGVPKDSPYPMQTFQLVGNYIQEEDAEFDKHAKMIRENFPKDYVILGSIGRLIKIDNPEYLNAVLAIMNKNPKTIYLACGDGDKRNIEFFIKEHGLEGRFLFPGFVPSKLYGRVIDVYLNTFPEPGGESVNEFRALGSDKFVVSLV